MRTKPYFQHDYYARNDPKLQDVFATHGCEGIGVFWCIVEMLYEQGGYLELKQCKSIAFTLHVQPKVVTSIVSDFELFKIDGERFFSASILARLDKQKSVSESRKLAASTRWQNKSNANAEQVESKNIVQQPASSDLFEQVEPAEKQNWKAIIDAWNSTCISYPKLTRFSDKRKNKVAVRLKEMGGGDKALEICKELFVKMEGCSFLKGDNRRGWKATFDWLFDNGNNWVKVYEGNYDNGTANQPNSTGSFATDAGYSQRQCEAASLIAELRNGNS